MPTSWLQALQAVFTEADNVSEPADKKYHQTHGNLDISGMGTLLNGNAPTALYKLAKKTRISTFLRANFGTV